MKTIFLLLTFFIILSGCKNDEIKQKINDNSVHIKNETVKEYSSDSETTIIPLGIFQHNDPALIENYKKIFINHFIYMPSSISISTGKNMELKRIFFSYETELLFTDEEWEEFFKLQENPKSHGTLYSADLVKLNKNVYSASNSLTTPSLKRKYIPINDKIDFYLIILEDKYYVVFEEIDINNLKFLEQIPWMEVQIIEKA